MKYSTNSLNNNKYYIGNSKIVTNLNQRLYYNEIKKKDIYYKSFLEKAYELLDDNVNLYNNKNTKKNKKKNYFRKKINAEMKKIKRKIMKNMKIMIKMKNMKKRKKIILHI